MQIYGPMFDRRRKAVVRKYTPKFFNILRRQYMAFIKAVKVYGLAYARANMDKIINPAETVTFLKKFYRMCAYIESNATLKNVQSGYKIKRVGQPKFSIGFDDLAPVIDDYFELYKWNKSGFPISETTKRDITKYLLNQVDNGMSLKEALQNFKTIAVDSPRSRAYTRAVQIANTESVRGMNFGSMIGAYMSGIDLEKIWVTMHDERVRPTADFPGPYSHRDLEGRVSDLMKPYYNGERINYPGDPEASIENTINCRCCLIYREKKKPKPIDYARSLLNFMTDFFIGFVLGQINARIYESERV